MDRGMLTIRKLDHQRESVRRAVFEWLMPHEVHALFILGNLAARFAGSHLYVAQRDDQWVGVAGYYQSPRSLIPFSTDPQVSRALTAHVAAIHQPINWLNGPAYAARSAVDELLDRGFALINDPRQVFMERAMPDASSLPPRQAQEDMVRPMREADVPQVARLARALRGNEDASPPTQEELARARLNTLRMLADVDGRVVSMASTNGKAIKAFQILAVATHPAYRRRGYARAVCAALMRRMEHDGARHCVLFTNVHNQAAQRCYERLGFRVTGDFIVAQLTPPDAAGVAAPPELQ